MNIRYELKCVLFFILIGAVVSCSGKKESTEEASHEHDHGTEASSEADWKEMDRFHMIMAETFHPFKDSANLTPIKAHAEHLAMEAETWASSTLPDKVNNDGMKAKLGKLKGDTRALADAVKSGAADNEIGAKLTETHDLFHEIMEAWHH